MFFFEFDYKRAKIQSNETNDKRGLKRKQEA